MFIPGGLGLPWRTVPTSCGQIMQGLEHTCLELTHQWLFLWNIAQMHFAELVDSISSRKPYREVHFTLRMELAVEMVVLGLLCVFW